MPRGRWVFFLLLAGGAALRVAVMLAYRPVLPLPKDSLMYVERAVTMSPAGSFHPFLYSVLLRPFLATGELAWIGLGQHLAGLVMAALLYLLLRRLSLHPVVAALGAAPVLFDGYQINIEHHVLSETFCQLFIVGALVLLVWKERPGIAVVATAGALIAAASVTRFAALAVIVAAVVYVATQKLGWARVAALLAGFVLALGAYGVWLRLYGEDAAITNRNGFYLYGRVVSFANCGEVEIPTRLRVFCPRQRRGGAMAGLFTSGLPDEVRRDTSNNSRALEFATRMIVAKPGAYLAAVLSDFLMYFGADEPQTREPGAGKWVFKEGAADMRISGHVDKFRETVPAGTVDDLRFRVNRDLAGFLHAYQGVVWTYGPLLAVLLVLGVMGGIAGSRRRRARALGPASWLFTLAAVGLLLFPPVFAVYHVRYVLPAIPLVGAAGALGASAVASMLRGSRASV